ncbi:unnamed protein product, partial [marine sediment metagenome]
MAKEKKEGLVKDLAEKAKRGELKAGNSLRTANRSNSQNSAACVNSLD